MRPTMTALRAVDEPAAAGPEPASARQSREPAASSDHSVYLLGRPKLKQFLRFVRRHAIEPASEDGLIEEWQAARQRIAVLEKEEAGCADYAGTTAIEVDSAYEPLLIDFLSDPLVRNGFNTVPTEVAWVELERLVVYQKHIDLSYVRELKRRLGPVLSDEELFRTCLPYHHPHPPARWSRLDDDSYVFVSSSNDLRFLGAMPLQPEHIQGYAHPGALLGVIGLAVGFGSNFLNAICAENRVILNNGSHRAYALRELGLTRVPCVVQHASTRDELEAIAASDICRDPDYFLRNPRPPMLKDYFDRRLTKVMPVQRVQRQVKVRYSISEYYTPSL